MCLLATPAVSVVHAIDIDCPVAKAFDFMRDVQQWLPWVMPQAQAVQPLPLGQWLVRTHNGLAKLRPRFNQALGTLEYELVATAKSWRVPVRLVATRTGCYLAATFVKPAHLTADAFAHRMQHTTSALHILKLVLEQG